MEDILLVNGINDKYWDRSSLLDIVMIISDKIYVLYNNIGEIIKKYRKKIDKSDVSDFFKMGYVKYDDITFQSILVEKMRDEYLYKQTTINTNKKEDLLELLDISRKLYNKLEILYNMLINRISENSNHEDFNTKIKIEPKLKSLLKKYMNTDKKCDCDEVKKENEKLKAEINKLKAEINKLKEKKMNNLKMKITNLKNLDNKIIL